MDLIPLRPHDATPAQVDLTRFYNLPLGTKDGDLATGPFPELPPQLHQFEGVVFDVRGQIELAGVPALHRGRPLPLSVPAIPVDAHVQRFHMLHTTGYETAEGATRIKKLNSRQVRSH